MLEESQVHLLEGICRWLPVVGQHERYNLWLDVDISQSSAANVLAYYNFRLHT